MGVQLLPSGAGKGRYRWLGIRRQQAQKGDTPLKYARFWDTAKKYFREVKRVKKSLLPLVFPGILALFVWLPLVFLISGSLMGSEELTENLAPVLGSAAGQVQWTLLPRYPTLRPYVELLLDSPEFFVMFWNSVKITALTLLGQLAVGAPAAWGFAWFRFPGKKLLLTLYIVLMLMPFQVTMVSSYLVLNRLSLLDTHWAVILPGVFSTFPVFIMTRFFQGIPKGVLESAALDGAGHLRIFFTMGLPLGAPGVMSAMVLSFLECWNLIEQPMTFLTTPSLWPLSLYLPNIGPGQAGLALAASVVTLVPAVLVFLCGQKDLERGIIAASVKE